MKHIHTTATDVRHIKEKAKALRKEQGIQHTKALEIAAKEAGYDSYYHVTVCHAKSNVTPIANLLGKLKFKTVYFGLGIVAHRFEMDDPKALNEVTDQLDELMEELEDHQDADGEYSDDDSMRIASTCEALVKAEPAFLDGYAHQVFALLNLDEYEKAIQIGQPAFDAALALIKALPECRNVDYYELKNRPFFRLARNLVLSYAYNDQQEQAKRVARAVLNVNQNDNCGFETYLDDEFYDTLDD